MAERLAIEGGEPVRKQPFPPWPRATPGAHKALADVLDSGHWWQSGGGRAEELERWLERYHGVIGALALTNGTHALELAFRALGVGPGDEVLVPAVTFVSTATAVSLVGAAPVPVDVDACTLCVHVEDLERKLSPRSRVVVPVHLAGQPANMTEIMRIARCAGLAVVEDCAQALGAEWDGRKVGTFGDLTSFSFQASKLLSAGEGGGLLVRSDGDLLERARLLANCGRGRGQPTFDHRVIGSNFRMTEFQAALILAQTDDYEELWRRRDAAARRLSEVLESEDFGQAIQLASGVTKMMWYAFPIRVHGPDGRFDNLAFAHALTAEGVPANQLFPPFYDTPAYAESLESPPRCPHAEEASRSFVWLHHRVLLDGERGIHDVARAVGKVARANPASFQS
jgi:3-amino-5-hydroxybenzoate synthase